MKVEEENRSAWSAIKAAITFLASLLLRRRPYSGSLTGNRVLVLALTHLGDCILAAPLFRATQKEVGEGGLCDIVVKKGLGSLFAGRDTSTFEVFEFACPWVGSVPWPEGLIRWVEILFRLRARSYDVVVVTNAHPFTSLTARLIARQVAIGFSTGEENLLDLSVKQTSVAGHVSRRMSALAQILGTQSLASPTLVHLALDEVSAEDAATLVGKWAQSPEVKGRVLLCIHPGAGGEAKRWPVNNFLTLLEALSANFNIGLILVGAAQEAAATATMVSVLSGRIPVLDLTEQLGLAGLAGVFKAAHLYIGNDSGPTHLAAASGANVLVIFGPASSAAQWRPLGQSVTVVDLESRGFYEKCSVPIVLESILADGSKKSAFPCASRLQRPDVFPIAATGSVVK